MVSHSPAPAVPPNGVVPAYKATGAFETSKGTLYLSKPYRSKASKKLRTLITFAPRKSAFDIGNERSSANEFRGFFTLFWISIFIFTVQTYVRSIETSGSALNLQFASMFSQHALTLAASDAVLVLSTGLCVPFALAIKNGWIRYYWTGVIIQHLLQTSVLFGAIIWTFNRNWPWVQSGFLTLHSLVMVMKMHSYMTVNGQLDDVNRSAESILQDLREATKMVGGWESAIIDANVAANANGSTDSDAPTGASDSNPTTNGASPAGVGTPKAPEGTSTSYVDSKTAHQLRRRLSAIAALGGGPVRHEAIIQDNVLARPVNPHPLVNHPDADIAELAQAYTDLKADLVSTGPERVAWPNNITWKNFVVYQLIPTLVYELEYPRTDRIRPLYLFEKTVATFGTFALLYTVTESFILPYTPSADQSFFRSLLDLALPFMVAYILLFYIIFECICNGFAELAYFADRQFYEDWYVFLNDRNTHLLLYRATRIYREFKHTSDLFLDARAPFLVWNSTSWDEFSRKWNKPVHTFLLRHVYAATILSYRISKWSAMLVTFLLSACAHELVMAVVTKKLRMYLFILQIVQIPLIALSRLPIIKENKLLGNIVFWLGLYAGFPLLCVAYVAY